MARTPEGAALTEAQRRQLARVKARAVSSLIRVWPDLDWVQFERVWPEWVRIAYSITASNRAAATQITAAYLKTYRLVEGVPGEVVPQLASALDAAMFEAGMGATARTQLTRAAYLAAGETDPRAARQILMEARRKALDSAAGVMARHILAGPRETTYRTMEADRYALGWARVTDGRPCFFCAMLASRGAQYKTAARAGQGRHFHDRCGCTVELVYSDAYTLPGRADEYDDLWQETTGDESGAGKVRAFRRAYDAAYPH